MQLKTEEIFNLFLIISAIHGILFSVFLLRHKQSKKEGVIYLNLLILMIALNNLQSWLLTQDIQLVWKIQIPWHFLLAPLFYTFLLHYLNLRKYFFNILTVIIPFFVLGIVLQVVYSSFLQDSNSQAEYAILYERYITFEEAISFIVSLSTFLFSLYIIRYGKRLFGDILKFDNLRWLNNFIILACVSYILWAVALGMTFYLQFENFIAFFYPLRIMTTVLIYWLGYDLLFSLKQIKERKEIRKNVQAFSINSTTTNDNKKAASDTGQKLSHLELHITKNRRYLDSQLSLESLAEELHVSTSQLSKIINEQTLHNFNYMINSYRVEFSKELLLNPSYSLYTITSIALEAGFNSKSTFYSAFSKHVGMTPSQFRKSHSGNSASIIPNAASHAHSNSSIHQ